MQNLRIKKSSAKVRRHNREEELEELQPVAAVTTVLNLPPDNQTGPKVHSNRAADHHRHNRPTSLSSRIDNTTKFAVIVLFVLLCGFVYLKGSSIGGVGAGAGTQQRHEPSYPIPNTGERPTSSKGRREEAFDFYSDDLKDPMYAGEVLKKRRERLATKNSNSANGKEGGDNVVGVVDLDSDDGDEAGSERKLINDEEASAKESLLGKFWKRFGLADPKASVTVVSDKSNGGSATNPAPNNIENPRPTTPKQKAGRGKFTLKDALLPSFSDINSLNSQMLWPKEDEELRSTIMSEAKARCRAVYFGLNHRNKDDGSAIRTPFRFPPAVGTKVFGFGNEGRKEARSSVAGQWNRFWIVSTGSDGNVLCNGGSTDVVTTADVVTAEGSKSPIVYISPPEDMYDVQLEAVPLTSLSSFVAAAQMPDGTGFDDLEDRTSHPNAVAAMSAINPKRPYETMRGVTTPTGNIHAGFRAYYGSEARAIAAANAKRASTTGGSAVAGEGGMPQSNSEDIALNDGACLKCGPSNANINGTFRGVTAAPTYVATKVSLDRVFYVGYGVTEVHAYIRHAGTYDLCIAVTDTSASNGIMVRLAASPANTDGGTLASTPLRGTQPISGRPDLTFDGSLTLSDTHNKLANNNKGSSSDTTTISLANMALNKDFQSYRYELSDLQAPRSLKPPLFDVFESDGITLPSVATEPKGPFGEFHQAVTHANHVFRCTVGTYGATPESAVVDEVQKPLCTAPLSAFSDVETYKNRYRLGSWVQLRDGICDGRRHCLVAKYEAGANAGASQHGSHFSAKGIDEQEQKAQLPQGFVKAESQSTLPLLKTDGWLWSSDVCVMVFFHQDGIAERLLNGKWTSAWGSSVMKQPLSNFVEYRLGRAIMSYPFPVFMEELPKYPKVKKIPGFFTYREYALMLTNDTRRVSVSEGQGAGASVYNLGAKSLATSGYQWLLQFVWGGCPSIVAGPSTCRDKGAIGMEGTWFKMARHFDNRLKVLKDTFSGQDGIAIKSLLRNTGAIPSNGAAPVAPEAQPTPDKVAEIIRNIKGISPLFPHHLLLEFSIWRHPMEDDVFLRQIAETLQKIDKAYQELRSYVKSVRDDFGVSSSATDAADRKRTLRKFSQQSVETGNLLELLLPSMPPPPLVIWHTKPAGILVDDNRDGSAQPRPSPAQLERHTDWTMMDALHNDPYRLDANSEGTRPTWEGLQLSEETRTSLKSLARDNPYFVVIPRHEMTMPFHVGNRYGHFGLHYGSSQAMCATGGTRPGYEMTKCLRKTWVDIMVAEMWVNAISSHTASVSP